LALQKLTKLDRQINDLVALRGHLQEIVAEWKTRLDIIPTGQPARLLESLILPPSRDDKRT
jgi:chorismate mutase